LKVSQARQMAQDNPDQWEEEVTELLEDRNANEDVDLLASIT